MYGSSTDQDVIGDGLSRKAQTIRVVAGFVIKNGTILVAQRSQNMSSAGKWEFPGGKVEVGESDESAIVRELREELDVTVCPHEIVGEVLDSSSDPQIHLIGIRCTLESGVPRALEHAQVRWMHPEALADLDLCRTDIALLRKLKPEWFIVERSFLEHP